jgi:hypothetical protein
MEEKESKPYRYNNKTYKSVVEEGKTLIQREDKPSPRASTTEFVTIGSYDQDGKFTPTDKATDDEQKNNKDLVKESKKSLAEAGITEDQPPTEVKAEEIKLKSRNLGTIIVYPNNMSSGQDRMEFSVWKYAARDITSNTVLQIGPSTLNSAANTGSEADITKNFTKVEGRPYVYLPITKISDSNSVDFQDDKLNEIQRMLANTSLGLMGGETKEALESSLTSSQADAYGKLLTSSAFGNLIRAYLAGNAVQANNLLTRATGAIFNPNLELLFNGPQLRQFSFAFDLFSKNFPEAKKVKDIIYFFKSNQAVRDNIGAVEGETGTGVFLNSPYVFKIRYIKGTGDSSASAVLAANAKEHQSIGKIKMCALQNCTVDYTPMGSYMTFNDEEATMVMYRITLQFKELTPIYASDYQSDHPIGF